MQTLREHRLGKKAIISSYPDKGWKLSTGKSVVESTTLAQPFCVNQAVRLGDLHAQFVIVRQFSHS